MKNDHPFNQIPSPNRANMEQNFSLSMNNEEDKNLLVSQEGIFASALHKNRISQPSSAQSLVMPILDCSNHKGDTRRQLFFNQMRLNDSQTNHDDEVDEIHSPSQDHFKQQQTGFWKAIEEEKQANKISDKQSDRMVFLEFASPNVKSTNSNTSISPESLQVIGAQNDAISKLRDPQKAAAATASVMQASKSEFSEFLIKPIDASAASEGQPRKPDEQNKIDLNKASSKESNKKENNPNSMNNFGYLSMDQQDQNTEKQPKLTSFMNLEVQNGNPVDLLSQHRRRGSNQLELPTNTMMGSSLVRRNSDKSQISQRTQQLQSAYPSGQANKPKKRNFLKAFYFTHKFLQKMRFVRKYKNIYMLERKHFKLIKDYAFGGLYERGGHRNNICTNLMGNLSYFLFDIKSPLQTFQPNSILLLFYEFSLLILLMLLTIYIPMKVCFSFAADFSQPEWITSLLDVVPYILISEMFININTAYFREGATVMDRKDIIKRYLSFKFWMDILTLICLQQNNIIQIIQFKFPTVFELFRLLLIIVLVAHICGCGFHLILDYQPQTNETWLSNSNVRDGSWMEKYVAALYFSFTTMITVGFGDIAPMSTTERIYVIVIQLVSCGVFAYAINAIGSIFQDIARRSSEYKQKKQEIMDYMNRRRISKSTQIKILKYLEYIHSSGEEGHQKGYNILGSLSKRLRDIVYKEYYGQILLDFNLFKRSFTEKFLKTLSLYMHEITLGPGEILYNQGEIDQRLFFVQSGLIQQYVDLQDNGHKDIVLSTLKPGSYFGMHGFLAKIESKSSARSINVSQLVTCNLDDFIQVIKQFPNDYETYCSLKDSISLGDDKVDVMCSSCGRYSHQVQNCPLLHYEIDKEAHIRRWIHNDPQQRDEKFTRVKPNFLKWSSRNQAPEETNRFTLDPITSSPIKRNKDFIHQRFNVFKELYELRMNLRHLRIKLRGPEEGNVGSDDEDLIYNEDDDRQFILKTDVPFYQTFYIHRAKQQLRGIFANEEIETEEDDMYEEEFADYEELMFNADDREDFVPGSSPLVSGNNQQSMQRMSTLSSQVHVPTEKSAFIKMPSTNSFHPSGKNRKRKNRKQSSEYEDDDDDDDDDEEENDDRENDNDDEDDEEEEYDDIVEGPMSDNVGNLLDSTKGKKQQKILKNKNKKNHHPPVPPKSSGKPSHQNHVVSFREENSGSQQGRKGSTMSKASKIELNTQITNEDNDQATPKQKSLFFRVAENPIPSQQTINQSPLRYQNRHKSANPSSFNVFNNGFETYLKSSNLDTPSSSMNSIVLQHQGSKRKGTIQSSIGQGSSKLRNSGSQDFSINIQRTGTLNSRGIIRNSNPVLSSKKISDPRTPMSRTKSIRSLKIDLREQTKVGPSSTQYVRHSNTQGDGLSEKQQQQKANNGPASLKVEMETIYVIMDFEKSCEFAYYLPHNNLQNILKQLKRILKVKVDYQAKQTLKTIKTTRTMKPPGSQVNSHSKRDQLSTYHRPSAVTQNNNILAQFAMGTSTQVAQGLGSAQGMQLMNVNAIITNPHDTYSPDSINSKSAEKIITLSFNQ